jgi:integrase
MPRPKKWPPPVYPHPSGQDRIRVNGRDIYLGRTGSDRAKAEYARVVAEIAAGQLPGADQAGERTLRELSVIWLEHATRQYRDEVGALKSEYQNHRDALAPLLALYGHTPAAEFTPRRLKAVQQEMVRRGWCRRVCNRQLVRLRTAFRWLESEGHIPRGTWEHLRTVRGLAEGQAQDRPDVLPVPEDVLAATLAECGRVIRAMVEVQLWTGTRPGELLGLRPCDLQRRDRVEVFPGHWLDAAGCWVYLPERWKTRHRGARKHRRVILFGPRAQQILAPFLSRPETDCLFSPREAAEAWLRSHGRAVRFRPDRTPGNRYAEKSYAHAITAAIERAYPVPAAVRGLKVVSERRSAVAAWRKAHVPYWHPHQLRHNAATRLVEQFGWEVAQTVLGHSSQKTTAIYALERFAGAAKAIGEGG